MKRKLFALVLILVLVAGAAYGQGTKKVKLLWWMHWASEVGRRSVFEDCAKDYMAANPNVEVEIVWWDKKNMYPALRNALAVRSGFPDLFYYEDDVLEFIDAGWLADLSKTVNWNNMRPDAKEFWTRKKKDGKTGVWAIGLERVLDLIYYSPEMFDKLGIQVPANKQFTSVDFLNAAKKMRAAGIDPFAQGIGDRDYPGMYLYRYVLLSQLGYEKYRDLWYGDASWKDPDVRKALEYCQELVKVPSMPSTYTTMTLGESHTYFHTNRKAAMFLVGTWYVGRAFVPQDKGGQSPDFRISFLKYPSMPGGKGTGWMITNYAGSLAVAEYSKNKAEALKLVNFLVSEKYGNLWLSRSVIPTGIKTNPATMEPTAFKWYFDELETALKDVKWADVKRTPDTPELWQVYVSVFNQGLPQNLITVDSAIEELEKVRVKAKAKK